jgi:hypothetical protein
MKMSAFVFLFFFLTKAGNRKVKQVLSRGVGSSGVGYKEGV